MRAQARIQGFGSAQPEAPSSSGASAPRSSSHSGPSSSYSSRGGMTGFGNPNFEDAASSRLAGRSTYMSRAQGLLNQAQALANKGQAALQMKRSGSLMRDDVRTPSCTTPQLHLLCCWVPARHGHG